MGDKAPGRAEPPDTGGGGGHVCAGLLRRQLPRSACALLPVSEHLSVGQDNQDQAGSGFFGELIPKSSEIGPELAQTDSTLKH